MSTLDAYSLVHELRDQWCRLTAFASSSFPSLSVQYLRFGAAKRVRWICQDLSWLTSTCPESRTKPLSDDEIEQAGLHLNSLYLHIRGALDNFSWALLWHLAPEKALKIEEKHKYQEVGLFTSTLKGVLKNEAESLLNAIESAREWDIVLKSKRDPVAHRLPLRVIPQVLTQSQAKQYEELNNQALGTMNDYMEKCKSEKEKRALDESIEGLLEHCAVIEKFGVEQKSRQNELYREMGELGTFMPWFSNSGEVMPLYPTIIDDCEQLSALSKEVISFFESINL